MKVERKGIRLLFLAEIFSIIAVFATLYTVNQYLGLLGLFAIPALILNIIGIIKLRKSNVEFNNVFFIFILMLILSIVSSVFSSFTELNWSNAVANSITTLNDILKIFSTICVIKGCGALVNRKKDGEFGKRTLIIYVFSVLVASALKVCLLFALLKDNEIFTITASAVSITLDLLAYILYVALLGNTIKRLK